MTDDFERHLNKNRSLARGYEISSLQGKVKEQAGERSDKGRPPSCFNCRKKNKCQEFKMKLTGGADGVASVGGDVVFLCDKYEAIPMRKEDKPLSNQQVKNFMKAAMKGRL